MKEFKLFGPHEMRQSARINPTYAPSALILETPGDSITSPPVNTLVLNLDDRLKLRLDALAAHNHKSLPVWAAEQLGRLAAYAGEIPIATYSPEWMAAFGSIGDPSFHAPERNVPSAVAGPTLSGTNFSEAV
jgi:hypothetical protein